MISFERQKMAFFKENSQLFLHKIESWGSTFEIREEKRKSGKIDNLELRVSESLKFKLGKNLKISLPVGIEPTTFRLTAERSAY